MRARAQLLGSDALAAGAEDGSTRGDVVEHAVLLSNFELVRAGEEDIEVVLVHPGRLGAGVLR